MIILLSFNRINSGRSIQTKYGFKYCLEQAKFQSYQFRQINPDVYYESLCNVKLLVSIVSIQADQSRLLSL